MPVPNEKIVLSVDQLQSKAPFHSVLPSKGESGILSMLPVYLISVLTKLLQASKFTTVSELAVV